jgi:hypothetical protein
VYYSNINSLSGSASSALVGPTGINPARYGNVPFTRVQNGSLSVQRSEFNAWNTSPSFSASGDPGKLVSTNIGMPSATRPARILATSLRFEF